MPKLNWKLFASVHGGDDRKHQEGLINEWIDNYGPQLIHCGITQQSIEDYFKDIPITTYRQLYKIHAYLNTLNDKLALIHATYRMVTKPGYAILKQHYPNCPMIAETEEAKQRLKELWFKRPRKILSTLLKNSDEQLLTAARKDLKYAKRFAERRSIK